MVSAGSASPRPESDHCTRTPANARRPHGRETLSETHVSVVRIADRRNRLSLSFISPSLVVFFSFPVSMPCLCIQDRVLVFSMYEGKRSNVSHSVSRPIYEESPFLLHRVDRIRLRSKGGRCGHLETRTICLRFA